MKTKTIEIVFHKGSYEREIQNCIDQIKCHMAVTQVIVKDEDEKPVNYPCPNCSAKTNGDVCDECGFDFTPNERET